jgi:hypothetical protein
MPTPSFILPTSVPVVDASVEALRVYDGSPAGFDVLPMSFTRGSSATRTDSAGNIVSAVPYNIFTYSEQLENILWLKNNITITANADTAPNGLVVADSYLSSVTVGPHPCYQSNVLPSNTYTYSVYAKKVNSRYISLKGAGGRFIWAGVIFDLDTATVVSIQNNNIPGVTGNVSSVGGGWYRISMTATSNFNDFGLQYASSPSNTFGDYGDLSIAGSGVVDYMLWGMQAVVGTEPLPYQETVTRLALPRLDYRNADGTLSSTPRLLLEPQRTNDLQFSEQLDNNYWTKDGATITANDTISPDGYQNADLISYTGGNLRVFQSNAKAASSLTYTFSAYVKRDTMNQLRMSIDGASVANRADAIFNLSTGTLSNTSVFGTFTNQSGSIVDVGNGWYRCTITATSGIETTIRNLFYGVTSESVYIYGCQLEAGAYPTTYIPTTTAAVTRLADGCSVTGVADLIGQTEGTLFAEVDLTLAKNNTSSGNGILEVFTNTGRTNAVTILKSAAVNQILFALRVNSVNTFITGGAYVSGTNKIALAYKSGQIACYVNGILVNTSSLSFTFSASIDAVNVGAYTTNVIDDRISQAALYTTRLSNSELQSLTTL